MNRREQDIGPMVIKQCKVLLSYEVVIKYRGLNYHILEALSCLITPYLLLNKMKPKTRMLINAK